MPDYENDSLTDYGKQEAKALSKRFALMGLDKIYSSTMGRAMMTADYTAKTLKLPIEGVDFAREDLTMRDFGFLENGHHTWCFWINEYISAFLSDDVKKLGDKWYESPRFENTNFKSGTLRVKKATIEFIENLGFRYNEKNGTYKSEKAKYGRVALFAHGGFSMIFASCLLNVPYPMISTMFRTMMTSTVTVYRLKDDGEEHVPQICLYGNDSHLYKEELLENFDGRTF